MLAEVRVKHDILFPNCKKNPLSFIYLSVILPGKLTENTFSFAATTWGIVTWERRGMNEPIVNWGLLVKV
jgi:hypothetical protein